MRRTALILFVGTLLARALCIPFMNIPYDEAAYSWTARNLAQDGGWFDLYGKSDLFFFPPLFNYIAALFIKIGVDRLYAVRIVTTLFSSGIPPLMYILALRSGLTRRAGLIAAALWILLPWGWHLSVVGMVETPWIFFLLLAIFFLQSAAEKGQRRDAIFSALAFGAALWIKETALGAAPLFIFFLRCDRRLLSLWGGTAALLALPLFLQSFLPHQYDLFFEVTTPLLAWNSLGFADIVINWGVIHGMDRLPWSRLVPYAILLSLVPAALSLAVTGRSAYREHFILRFSLGFLLIFIPFFIFFPKRFPYYLLPVQLFLSFFVARFFSDRPRYAVLLGVPIVAVALWALPQFGDRSDEEHYRDAFAIVERESPGAGIALPLPRKAELVAERAGAHPRLVPTEWVSCVGRAEECIFANDYFLTDPMFLMMLFCRQWPMSPDTCDLPALTAARRRLTPVGTWPFFTLYRIGPPPENGS